MARQVLIISVVLCLLVGFSHSQELTDDESYDALTALKQSYPNLATYTEGGRITRIFGTPFGSGTSPTVTGDSFVKRYGQIYGIGPGNLAVIDPHGLRPHVQPLVYQPRNDTYKFTLLNYFQQVDGLPVWGSELRLLVRNQPGYPLVEAASSLRDISRYRPDRAALASDVIAVQRSFLIAWPSLVNFSEPRLVVWAGYDTIGADPRIGIEFTAWDSEPATEKYLFIVDPLTMSLLYSQDLIIRIDVVGQVTGNATENFKSEQCGNEVPTAMPWARVYIQGGDTSFADTSGNYTIPNDDTVAVTVVSKVKGQWFNVRNSGGGDASLTQTVTPPGPADFLHNPNNTELTRAEVNGYIHANVVRDYVMKYNPLYPIIHDQENFTVYVNRTDGYCPGNAWYDGASINFCRSSSPYPNTAFSTVVHHEYGHHIVQCGGSGQDQYGEGMSDVMGVLITDDAGLAYGFFGQCNQPLRNADNDMQYPCNDESHACAPLLSGCVWETRNALLATHPDEYRDIISSLAINAVPLHDGDRISPSITIDYLVLDDDDGDFMNGTPHLAEICTGFGAHNMGCPAMVFAYPDGFPEMVDPFGGTGLRLTIYPFGEQPQPGTGLLHYRSGSTWLTTPLVEDTANTYLAEFGPANCGTDVSYYISIQSISGETVTDPSDAPTHTYRTVCGTGESIVFADDFSSNQGWTGLGGTGEWTIGPATGGSGDDDMGGPDPEYDHSPTDDNGVLGNDLTEQSGGDYASSITSTQYVTSPIINCSGLTNLRLAFWRWLGVESSFYDHASFQVYTGTRWANLYGNAIDNLDDGAWVRCFYNISNYANNNPNFQIRFAIGPTNSSIQFCGWNVDDLKVYKILCDTSTLGTVAGTVRGLYGNIAGCIVHAQDSLSHNAYDTSGTGGAYSLVMPQGVYDISFSHVDYWDSTIVDLVVEVRDTLALDMTLRERCRYVAGDANGNGIFSGIDVVYSVSYLRGGSLPPPDSCNCPPHGVHFTAADANGDCIFNGLDATYSVRYFKGFGDGPVPCPDCRPEGFDVPNLPINPAVLQPRNIPQPTDKRD